MGNTPPESAFAGVAVHVDALAAFHTDPLDRDMRAVLRWCDWLGATWRAVRLNAEARPTRGPLARHFSPARGRSIHAEFGMCRPEGGR